MFQRYVLQDGEVHVNGVHLLVLQQLAALNNITLRDELKAVAVEPRTRRVRVVGAYLGPCVRGRGVRVRVRVQRVRAGCVCVPWSHNSQQKIKFVRVGCVWGGSCRAP